jgi:uncharacterized protein YndB with AHSA1/START domain
MSTLTTSPEFVINREFKAPRDLVWQAFTDPDRLRHWFGHQGSTVIASKMDLRPGGLYHYGLRTPGQPEMWGKNVYREIIPPSKLVFLNSFSDPTGGLSRHPLSPTWPREMLTTVTFAEQNGQTILSIRWVPWEATEEEITTFANALEACRQGWTGALNQLETYLEKVS